MSDYNRTTRVCSVDQLRPEMLQAIQDYFQKNELGDLQAETLACCETVSTKKKTGKLAFWLTGNPDTTIHVDIVLTPEFLIWVHLGDKTGMRVNGASLKNIRTEYYMSLSKQEANLSIMGFISDAKSGVRGTIALGPEPAAEKFCEQVKQAILKVSPPAKKKIFGIPLE
ncbi:MAG: hypothetical protein QM730_06620 [Anaerolineales bacterium]